jgi:hypothetical protein
MGDPVATVGNALRKSKNADRMGFFFNRGGEKGDARVSFDLQKIGLQPAQEKRLSLAILG